MVELSDKELYTLFKAIYAILDNQDDILKCIKHYDHDSGIKRDCLNIAMHHKKMDEHRRVDIL